MKLITRYLLKELGVPFLLGLVLFTFVLLFGKFLKLTDLVVNQGVNLFDLVVFVLLGIPETFPLIVPMAMVLATLMAYGRLASDNEITILRISGLPLLSLLLPTLATGLFLSLVLVGFTEYGAPSVAEYRYKKLAEMKQPDPADLMKPKSYLEFGDFTIYAETVNGPEMGGVYLEDRRDENTKIIYSQRGTWEETNSGHRLVLRNGSVHQKGEGTTRYRVLNFQTQTIQFEIGATKSSGQQDEVRSITERWAEYREAEEQLQSLRERLGDADINDRQKQKFTHARNAMITRGISFHRSIAFPFASFFLVLIAAPIGMLAQNEGKSIGFSVSIGIIFVYYMVTTLAEPLALNHWLSPGVAMWSANILFGLIGIGLYGWISRNK